MPATERESAPEGRPTLPSLPVLMSDLGHVVFRWDAATDAMLWGDNVATVFANCPPEAIGTGKAFAQMIEPRPLIRAEAIERAGKAQAGTGGRYQIEYGLRFLPGAPLQWIEESGHCSPDKSGAPASAHGIIRLINERHARDEVLLKLAQRDAMTGELDRTQLLNALAETIAEATRYRGTCAFMLVGINQLSRINDAFGFNVADEVICEVARRIRPRLRGGDVLGRFSNNKFGIVLKNCSSDDMAVAAERFLAAIRNDVVPTGSGPVAVSASVGGVTTPRYARTIEDVINRAQEALDAAKRRRPGSFEAWGPNAERESLRRLNIRMTEEIVTALNERRVVTAFEPVATTTDSRSPAFYECLVRMAQPDGQFLMAPDIVPVAERVGLIRLVDHRVLELVIAELTATPHIRLSLNISPATAIDPDWWSTIESSLAAAPGVAERLIVEITETVAIRDLDDIGNFVKRLKNLGTRIAIDDFGAGYTSFRNLRRLGVDIVKIDGAFVQHLAQSHDDRAFVQTLIDLARRLHIETVAEWVQDETSAALLRDWGCNYLQGRLLGLASMERPWLAAPQDQTFGRDAGPHQGRRDV